MKELKGNFTWQSFLTLEEMGAVDDEVIQRQDGRRQLKVKITKDFMLAIIFTVKKSGMNGVDFTDEDKSREIRM